MSSLIVEVCEIKHIRPHENADLLEVATIKGWDVVIQKSLNLKVGDPVVYFPPDSVMDEELADRLGIKKYLGKVNHMGPLSYKVKAARLRGTPSYGTIDHEVPCGFKVGDDVTNLYGIRKFEPKEEPVKNRNKQGDQAKDHSCFYRYTDIENIRNYPDLLKDGEDVIMDEKAHGSLLRAGLILDKNEKGSPEYLYMAGSNKVQRKEFDAYGKPSQFWLPLNDEKFCLMLWAINKKYGKNVIVYSELIGSKIQDMEYGHKPGEISYRAFDIRVGTEFLDVDEKLNWFAQYDIPICPILYRGPFSWDKVEEFTYGNTTICDPVLAGKFKGREGVVITPIKERRDKTGKRVILKSISADYLARKGGTEYH